MKFKAITSTDDGRLTAGKVYHGQIVLKDKSQETTFGKHDYQITSIVVFDDMGTWMTFNPSVFVPVEAINE